MCPDQELLERFALGLLSEEELAPLEEHLETCQRCVQTLLESSPSDTVIEALREAPRTLERRAEVAEGIRRVETAVLARLRDPYHTRPETPWGNKPKVPSPKSKVSDTDDGDDTSSAGDHYPTLSPTPEARTAPDDEEESYSFLSPALSGDEIGRLGPYRILRVLGTGGMGVVFEAEDPQLKRRVALKVMKPGVAANLSARKRFLREAQTAASVEHDHIVSVYQVGEDRGVPFIAMPLLRGETLASRLERCSAGDAARDGSSAPAQPDTETRGRGDAENVDARTPRVAASPHPRVLSNPRGALSTTELTRVGREIALGLAAAHRRGLIHRDIKPSNIWLEEETGRVKILDFGLARAGEGGEQLTHSGSLLGTPAYMSPEQASGGVADARSDLFSLGSVLYHAATGRRPFIGRDTLTTLVAVTTTEPPAPRSLNPSLPSEMNDLIVSLLSKDPAGRPQSARDVAERLASVAQASSLVAQPPSAVAADAAMEDGLPSPSNQQLDGLGRPSSFEGGLQHDGGTERQSDGGTESTATVSPSLPPSVCPSPSPSLAPSPTLSLSPSPPPPPRRRSLIMLATAAAAAAVLAGIIITIKNEKGETIVQFESDKPVVFDKLAPGTKVIVENKADEEGSGNSAQGTDNPKSKIEHPKSWHGWSADAPAPAIAPFDAAQARKHQQEWADYLKLPLEYTNTIGMKFILIPPGEFMMGSTPEEIEEQGGIKGESPQHKVVLTRPFYLAVHEVTQNEYGMVVGVNPSHFAKTGSDKNLARQVADLETAGFPVEDVSWNDAAAFSEKLSEQEELSPFYFCAADTVTSLKGSGYRLPTDAEWEFACRAGTTTRFWIGDRDQELISAGWFAANSGGRTHEVAELAENAFGLFDMHGNVLEWVEDAWEPTFYDGFATKPAIDPKPPASSELPRVFRGGNWRDSASACRSAHHYPCAPTGTVISIGIRLALAVDSFRDKALSPKTIALNTESKIENPASGETPPPAIAPFDAAQAKKHQQAWADYLKLPLEYTNSIGMKLILIPPGEFMMGSTPKEIETVLNSGNSSDKHWQECIRSEGPHHKIVLTRPFFLSVHEVTQREYEAVVGKNPSYFAKTGRIPDLVAKVANHDTANYPVEGVSRNDAAEFCAILSKRENLKPFYFRAAETVSPVKGEGYRLPTEAEWEFACRAGTTDRFWNGDESPAGWWSLNSGGRTHEVAEFPRNPFGLFDVHGNVCEWVEDSWERDYYENLSEKSAVAPKLPFYSTPLGVLRGGQYANSANDCRSSHRFAFGPTGGAPDLGFRVALMADAVRGGASAAKARPQISKTHDQSPKTVVLNPKSEIENPKSAPSLPAMSEMSLVTEPAAIHGAKSWTLETIDDRGDIYKMEFNPDGTLLATYGEDGAVRLWKSETGELARIFIGADSPSGGIAWSSDGAAIAVAAGTKIKAWEAATGKNVCTIALQDGEAASLAWSPDGKIFAVGQRPLDQPEAPARHLCLYDATTGKLVAVRHRDDWSVEQIAWSPDSKRVLQVGRYWRCDLLDLESDSVRHVGDWAPSKDVPLDWNFDRSVAWTAKGVPVIAGIAEIEKELVIQLWQADPPKLLRTFSAASDDEQLWRPCLAADARLICAVAMYKGRGEFERSLVAWDCSSGELLWRRDNPPFVGDYTSSEFQPRYAASRDGKFLARCGRTRGGPALFNLRTGDQCSERGRIDGYWHDYLPRCVAAWSPDGQSLACRGEDGAIRYWDNTTRWPRAAGAAQLKTGNSPVIRYPVCGLSWSQDASRLTLLYDLFRRVEVQSVAQGQAELINDCPPDRAEAEGAYVPVFSPDGKFFAGHFGNRPLRLFRTAGARLFKTLDVATDRAVNWSPDAKQVAVRRNEATEIWDIEQNECVRRFDGGSASLVWSPDGSRFVLSGSGESSIHDAVSVNVLHSLDDPPIGPAKVWPRMSWSPDGRHIAGRGRVWDADTGEVVARLPSAALEGEIGAPAWSPDGATLAYLGPDRAVVVASVTNKVVSAEAGDELNDDRRPDTPRGETDHAERGDYGDRTADAALSPKREATLLTFNRGQVLSIAPSGHYRASPRADELLLYVVETADGQETLSREQFAERFGWKNDVGWALERKAEGRRQKAEENPNPEIQNPKSLSALALVQRPAALPGIDSWTIAPRTPPGAFNQVQPIDLSPDGKWLAHAGQDGVVRLIDAASGKVERLHFGHDGPLTAVAFSPDSNLLASLDAVSGNVRVWQAATGKQIHSVYAGPGALYSSLRWSPDAATLAICVEQNPLRLVDMASGEFLPQPIGHDSVYPNFFAWSPDARQFVSLAVGNKLRVWDAATLESTLTLDGKCDTVTHALAWSPDGAIIADHAGHGEIRVWDALSGTLLRTLADKHPVWDARIAWLPDGKTIAINGGDGSHGWRLWDVVTGKPVTDVVPYGFIWGFSLSRNGTTLAMGDHHIGIFDVASRALMREIRSLAWAESAAWSPNGRELAVTGDDMAIWSSGGSTGLAMLPTANLLGVHWLPDGEAIVNTHGRFAQLYERRGQHWEGARLPIDVAHEEGGVHTSLSPDGKRIAWTQAANDGSGKRRIAIWDLAVANPLVETEPFTTDYHPSLAWSPDGKLLAAGTGDGASAIYDAATGKRVGELSRAKGPIRPIAFSPDGKTIAAGYGGNGNGFVRLYDVRALVGAAGSNFGEVPRSEDGPPGPSSNEHDGLGRPSSGKSTQATDGVPYRELTCNSGPQVPEIVALNWSADGRMLKVLDRAAVYVFDATTGDLLTKVPRLDRTPHDKRPANFSPDGRYRAVATTCTRVWDLAELNEAAAKVAPTLRGGEAVAKGDGLSPPSRSAGSTLENPKLKLVASVVPLGHGQAVVVSADGHWLGTRGAEKEIVYVIQTAAGQETLSPREFYKRFGWKNDPSKVVLPE